MQSSFGFGQVGGVCLILNPRYLLGALEPSVYEAYKVKNRRRYQLTYKAMSEMMINNSLVKVKEAPPYSKELEGDVLLNSRARASYDAKTGSYAFTSKLSKAPVFDTANASAVSAILAQNATSGVGVDQELISAVPSWNPTFVDRNFTEAEVAYCQSQPSPPASFAARWAGKEAVFKALGVSSKGAAAPMKEIEILPDTAGVPTVSLHGDAKSAADAKGITKVLISLSHSEVCFFSLYITMLHKLNHLSSLDYRHRIRTSHIRIEVVSLPSLISSRRIICILSSYRSISGLLNCHHVYVAFIMYLLHASCLYYDLEYNRFFAFNRLSS